MSTLRQSISNRLILIDQTLTVDVGVAYAPGDALAAKVELQNVTEEARGAGAIRSIIIGDLAKQGVVIDFLFFDDAIASIPVANTAFDLADADAAKFIGMMQLTTASLLVDNAVSFVQPPSVLPFIAAGTSLWMVPVCRGTPTYATAGDISVRIVIGRG